MTTGRGLAVVVCLSAMCLSGVGITRAQEQEGVLDQDPDKGQQQDEDGTEPETEESTAAAGEETEAPKDEGYIEDVTVTAIRVETDLMKTPVAVTVIDQETMDREEVKDIRDMAQMVPNMDIATINRQSTPIISLRGVRSTNETELGDSAVGVHLDDIYSPRMQGILALMFNNERGEAAKQVDKGSFSMPREYGFGVSKKF